MKFFDNGHKILMKRKDFVQCYFTLRPLFKSYFEGELPTSDFLDKLNRVYHIWFS